MDLPFVLRPSLAAHRWGACLVLVIGTGIVGFVAGGALVTVPFIDGKLPVRALLAVVVVAVAVTPLYPVFTDIAPTLTRERVIQSLRPLGAVVLALVGYLPTAVGVPGAMPTTNFFIALLAVGLVAIVVAGEYAWAVILMLGLTAMLLDTTLTVTHAIDKIAAFLPTVALPLAVLLAAGFGPKEWKELA